MKHITSINIEIPTLGKFNNFFNSKISLDESDIVIFKPFLEYSGVESQYQGKDSYGEKSSNIIKEDTEYWKTELKSFLSSGKNVFVITSEVYSFFVKTGKHEYSGIGRNARRTDYVSEFNNYNFLEINDLKLTNANGKSFKVIENFMSPFISNFESILNFKCYISSDKIIPFLTTKNGREIVAGIIKYEKGNIILLPNIDFEDLTEIKRNKEVWTKEAVSLGKSFINFLVELDNKIINNTEKSIKPNWFFNQEYNLKIEVEIKNKIKINEENIKNLLEENEVLSKKIENETIIKNLIFETGKPLENAVLKSLEILGYKAENYDDGKLELDAVILSPENERYIGECEGKDNKDIDISKFRQLSDSLAEDFERDDVVEKAKGIIFGNPQRLIDVKERTLDFTLKCKNGAKREKIALIKTSDLFYVTRYILETNDEEFKKLCRDAIYNQLGGLVTLPKIPIQSFS